MKIRQKETSSSKEVNVKSDNHRQRQKIRSSREIDREDPATLNKNAVDSVEERRAVPDSALPKRAKEERSPDASLSSKANVKSDNHRRRQKRRSGQEIDRENPATSNRNAVDSIEGRRAVPDNALPKQGIEEGSSDALIRAISDHYKGKQTSQDASVGRNLSSTNVRLPEMTETKERENTEKSTTKTPGNTIDSRSRSSSTIVPPPPELARSSDYSPPPGAVAVYTTSGNGPESSARDANTSSTQVPVGEVHTLVSAELVPSDHTAVNQTSGAVNAVEVQPDERRFSSLLKDRRICSLMLLMMLIIAGLVAGLLLSNSDGGNDAPVQESDLPWSGTEEPLDSPVIGATVLAANQLLFDKEVLGLLPENSQLLLEQDESSPQRAALDWLVKKHILEEYSVARIIQRYVLATFYFSTGGSEWWNKEGWLESGTHECQWYSNSLLLFGEKPCTQGILYGLVVSENGLNGSIPEDLGLLSTLGKKTTGPG
jgi:hypothetical protein